MVNPTNTTPAKPVGTPRVIPAEPAAVATTGVATPPNPTPAPPQVPPGATVANNLAAIAKETAIDAELDLEAAAKRASAQLSADTASISNSAKYFWSRAVASVRGWSTKTWVYIAIGICAVIAVSFGTTAKRDEIPNVRFWANNQDIDGKVTAAKTDLETRIEDAKKSANTRIDSISASAAKKDADLESMRSQIAKLDARLTALEERSSSNPSSPAQKRRRR